MAKQILKNWGQFGNGILFPKLFWSEKNGVLIKKPFELRGWRQKFWVHYIIQRSVNVEKKNFFRSNTLEQLEFKLEKLWYLESYRKNRKGWSSSII